MTHLTVYDLLSEDMAIWANLIDQNHVHMRIKDENGVTVYSEKSHIFAWEQMVSLANQVLAVDKRIQEELGRLE